MEYLGLVSISKVWGMKSILIPIQLIPDKMKLDMNEILKVGTIIYEDYIKETENISKLDSFIGQNKRVSLNEDRELFNLCGQWSNIPDSGCSSEWLVMGPDPWQENSIPYIIDWTESNKTSQEIRETMLSLKEYKDKPIRVKECIIFTEFLEENAKPLLSCRFFYIVKNEIATKEYVINLLLSLKSIKKVDICMENDEVTSKGYGFIFLKEGFDIQQFIGSKEMKKESTIITIVNNNVSIIFNE